MANTGRETLKRLVNEQLLTIINNYETFIDYKFIITENLNKYEENIKGNEVFIVFTFGNGEMSYDKVIQPVTLDIVCNQNYASEILKIMDLYCQTYNYQKGSYDNNFIIQNYNTPSVNARFQNFDNNYAVVCSFNASFIVTPNASPISEIKIDNTELPFISATLVYSSGQDAMSFPYNQGTAQAPSYTNAYTQTINQDGTIVLTLRAFFNYSNAIITKVISMANLTATVSQNSTFAIDVKIGSTTLSYSTMKLTSFNVGQMQGGIPDITMTFTL